MVSTFTNNNSFFFVCKAVVKYPYVFYVIGKNGLESPCQAG